MAPAIAIAAMALAVSLLCVQASYAPAAAPKAPKGFFGVHVRSLDGGDFNRMRRANVGLVRTGFTFSTARPRENDEYDWTKFDGFVAGTARNGIDMLPVVHGLPPWMPGDEDSLLRDPSKSVWRGYLTALVRRYGSDGEFWALNPDIPYHPVRTWQIWNEPNSFVNWSNPDAGEYGRLLTISARAIHAVDRKAKIVSAGVVSKPFNDDSLAGARYLRRMFRSKAARRAADIIAIHPYTKTVREAKEMIEQARKVMDRAGLKRTPIWVTEIGWGTSTGPAESTRSGAEQASTGRRGANAGPRNWRRWSISAAKQRRNLRHSFEMALGQRKKLGVRRVVWYQWQQGPDDACGWCQTSGLVRQNGVGKQLLRVFSRIARL
jgi:hypothetical protein